ncbi:hypothetical protein K1719_037152 [Acacia pycnantha]|nr:hypothetical protein K1719_037152 [Acacia pycnantha]
MFIRRRIGARRRRRCGATPCDLMGFGHSSAIILNSLGMLKLVKFLVVGTLMMTSSSETVVHLSEEC